MTLTTMLVYIGIVAIILTLLVGFVMKGHKSWLMTFLQNFCGVLFLFSGWVKAVDPLGTAYKLEQYFAEFTTLFEGTWFSFLSPLFPVLNEYAIGFSVFMIIFEIILGLMLLLGMRSLLTSWLFLLLVVFFTFLTGFTFMTGYVPEGVTFWQFGGWEAFNENNMKVTDCGCFGDFIKLKPFTSFMKDVFLLIPAIYFVLRHKEMHKLFNKQVRTGIIGVATIGLFIYCLSNYKWDIPHTDFRPFKIGADIAGTKEREMEAAANVQITAWKLRNKNNPSQIVELSNDVYMKEFAKYPKAEWEVVEQVKTEPEIPKTKISDFEISDLEGYDATDELLHEEDFSFWIVCHKLKGESELHKVMVDDTTFTTDTTIVFNPETEEEEIKISNVVDKIEKVEKEQYVMNWNDHYEEKFKDYINPLVAAAAQDGHASHIFIGKFGADEIKNFAENVGPESAQYYMADDILLKTIVRSNPGVVLVKNGEIVYKWHLQKLPSYEEMKAKFGL